MSLFGVQKWVLLGIEGPKKGEEIELQESTLFIGRTEENAIVLNTPNISRQHASIQIRINEPWVEDLNSKNGTFVNGKAISRTALKAGDRLQMGECMFEVQCFGEHSDEAETAPTLGEPTIEETSVEKEVPLDPPLPQTLPKAKAFPPLLRNKRVLLYSSLGFFLIVLSLFLFQPGSKEKLPQQKTPKPETKLFKPVVQIPDDVSEEDLLVWKGRAETAMQYDDVAAAIPYLRKFLAVRKGDKQVEILLERAEKRLASLIDQYYENGVREYDRLYFDKAISEWRKVLSLAANFDPETFQRAKDKIAEAEAKLAEMN